ncbi:hypothetical protein [Victivallis vadensis]|uniref:hypothetical protein n=1 Tax=Victivallis vadensis TaxID=172901 RepID=UPI003D07D4ED
MAIKVIERENVNLLELNDIFNTVFTSIINEERQFIVICEKGILMGCSIDDERSLIRLYQSHKIENDAPPHKCIAFVNRWNNEKIVAKTMYKENQEDNDRFIAIEYDMSFDRGVIPYNLIKTIKWLLGIGSCMIDESVAVGIELKRLSV